MAPLLSLQNIRLTFGGKPLLTDATLSILPRDRICLIGHNGCGKSTLLKIAAGLIDFDEGDFFLQPGVRISYLAQEPNFPEDLTVFEIVEQGLDAQETPQHYKIDKVLEDLGLQKDAQIKTLSGGQKRRVGLAQVLVSEPDILLLDEPTNHLDLPVIQWLEQTLNGFPGAIVCISHDKTFLANTSRKTVWIDRGETRQLNKGFKFFEEWRTQFLEEESRALEKMDKRLAEETRWSHQGISARRKRNQGRLKRLYEMREKRASIIKRAKQKSLDVAESDMVSKEIIVAKNISKSYGDKVIVDDFSIRVLRGDRIGIVGPNGAGKTTLVSLLVGNLKPDQGRLRLAKTLEIAYLDQQREKLNPKKTLWETLTGGKTDHLFVQGKSRHVVAYLKDFQFSPDQIKSPVASLSGGEKNRLLLAMTLARDSNMLVLDEPTNDLDMDTLELLEDMLGRYEGTVILISHDRDFLDQVVTSTLFFEERGHITEYAGGYKDALAQQKGALKKTQPEQAVAKPERAKPKKEQPQKERKKFGYMQQRRLQELEKLMPATEQEIQEIEMALSDPDLYVKDAAKFDQLSSDLTGKKESLESFEMEWLELLELSGA